ncbi:uncharacterized protein C7orf50 homolog [Lingula anatina]|uniref:Uncharacterized protein C7orf50 homolog n=1 Tax=Lingula anatina TaxID=7574 RepID=A0A2R2MTQ8_LINAN|nr:uncharacterized protein C7orf50 homolog [Lingula anatina]|eukprot:XP_023933636.1 uncharacterized protein C7orf50 homolog [Lingula anatina]
MTKKRTANESQQLCTETITEKKKKKKEKKKVSSETDKVVGDSEKTSARDLALEYLKKWHENRKQWSFQKVRQVWILQHMYDTQKVPDEEFKILLEYMENSKGKARENTIKQAEVVIEKFEETDNDTAAKEGYMRARQVLQMLS